MLIDEMAILKCSNRLVGLMLPGVLKEEFASHLYEVKLYNAPFNLDHCFIVQQVCSVGMKCGYVVWGRPGENIPRLLNPTCASQEKV